MDFEPFLLNMIREEEVEVIKDVKLNTTINGHGTTLLHDAVKSNNSDLVKSLIDGGCKVDVADNEGNTPLILASKLFKGFSFDEIIIIDTLIDSGASVMLSNKFGKSAAEILISNSIVEGTIILSKSFEKLKKECGNDSLLTARKLMEFNCLLSQAVNLKDTSVTKYMLDNGCDVNERFGNAGFTALHRAVRSSDVEHVKLLLNYGADIDIENYLDHRKPVDLLEIERDESVEVLELLVDHGASLLDDYGDFVNDDFIKYGTKKFINALIRIYKLNFNRKVPSGETLLYLLASNDKFDPIEELQGQKLTMETVRYIHKKYRENTTALIQAARNGHVRTVEFLLKNRAQVNWTDHEEHSALSYAFYNTYRVGSEERVDLNLKCIEILLQRGADAQWKDTIEETLFDLVLESRKFILIKPVLAVLVLIEALGAELDESILNKIDSHTFFSSYFDSCKRKIEEMTNSMIIRSVSIFDVLTENKVEMVKFARNNGLVRKLELIAYSTRRSKLIYHKFLRKRVAELQEIVRVREETLNVLSRIIIKLRDNRIVLEEIVNYMSYKDMQVLTKV